MKLIKIESRHLLLDHTPMHNTIRIFEFLRKLDSKMALKQITASAGTKHLIKNK